MSGRLLTARDILTAMRCKKAAWLERDADKAETGPFPQRESVCRAAAGLFGDPVYVPQSGDAEERCFWTERLMQQGARVIADAVFTFEGVAAEADFLLCGEGGVSLFYAWDAFRTNGAHLVHAALAAHALSGLGYAVSRIVFLTIDPSYVRLGSIEPERLFNKEDVTSKVRLYLGQTARTADETGDMFAACREPYFEIGAHCFSPSRCPHFAGCARDAGLPKPNVFDLGGMQLETKLRLYGQGKTDFGTLSREKKLGAGAKIQILLALSGGGIFCDRKKTGAFLEGLRYPLYFLDFETVAPAVPLFDGMRPFEQMPFQYSLHVMAERGAAPAHFEFLAGPDADFRRALAERLCNDIPEDACVLAYNAAFEKGVILELAALFPDLSSHLAAVAANFSDLMTPFRACAVYAPAMKGSYSIKKVLPTLFPDDPAMDYANLTGVHNGAEAPEAFLKTAAATKEERERIRKELLCYCGLDTFAMVRITEKLYELAEG